MVIGRLVCALGGVVAGKELDTVCSYLLEMLNTAVRRKVRGSIDSYTCRVARFTQIIKE